jgi:hypothetical protein
MGGTLVAGSRPPRSAAGPADLPHLAVDTPGEHYSAEDRPTFCGDLPLMVLDAP